MTASKAAPTTRLSEESGLLEKMVAGPIMPKPKISYETTARLRQRGMRR